MTRFLATCAFVLFTVSSAFSMTIGEATEGVYRLYNGDRAHCSAVAVSPTQLVTAAHCVPNWKDPYNIRVFQRDAELNTTSFSAHMVTRVRYYRAEDTAFLELKDNSIRLTPVDVCKVERMEIGQEVWAIGYPFVDSLTITPGLFTTNYRLKGIGGLDSIFYQTTVPVEGGSSGGGLFRAEGEGVCLTGITTAHRIGRGFFPSFFANHESLMKITRGLLKE